MIQGMVVRSGVLRAGSWSRDLSGASGLSGWWRYSTPPPSRPASSKGEADSATSIQARPRRVRRVSERTIDIRKRRGVTPEILASTN